MLPRCAISIALVAACSSSPKPDVQPDPWDSSLPDTASAEPCIPDPTMATVIVTLDGMGQQGHDVEVRRDGQGVVLATGPRGCVVAEPGSDVFVEIVDDERQLMVDLRAGDVVDVKLPASSDSTELALRLPRSVFQANRYVAHIPGCDAVASTHDPGQTLRMAVPARCHDGSVDVLVSAVDPGGRDLSHILATDLSFDAPIDLEDWSPPRAGRRLALESGTATAHLWLDGAYIKEAPGIRIDDTIHFLGLPEGDFTVRAAVDVEVEEGVSIRRWQDLDAEDATVATEPTEAPVLTISEGTQEVMLTWDPPQTGRWEAILRFDAHPSWRVSGRAGAATLPLFPAPPVSTQVNLIDESPPSTFTIPEDSTPSLSEPVSFQYER